MITMINPMKIKYGKEPFQKALLLVSLPTTIGNDCDTTKFAAHCADTAIDMATLLILFGNISDNNTNTTGPIDNENDAINIKMPNKDRMPTFCCCKVTPKSKKPIIIPVEPI